MRDIVRQDFTHLPRTSAGVHQRTQFARRPGVRQYRLQIVTGVQLGGQILHGRAQARINGSRARVKSDR